MSDKAEMETEAISMDRSPFAEVPVEILISVGRARPLLKDLISLTDDTVFPLDREIDDPVELYVGDHLIGRGTLEEVGEAGSGRLGVRLTEISKLPKGI